MSLDAIPRPRIVTPSADRALLPRRDADERLALQLLMGDYSVDVVPMFVRAGTDVGLFFSRDAAAIIRLILERHAAAQPCEAFFVAADLQARGYTFEDPLYWEGLSHAGVPPVRQEHVDGLIRGLRAAARRREVAAAVLRATSRLSDWDDSIESILADVASAAGATPAPDVAFSESLPMLAATIGADVAREMLIDGLIGCGEIALVHGDPRAKKTLIVLSMCATMATGGALFGLDALRAGKARRVLYLTAEDSLRRTVARATEIVHGLGHDDLPEGFRLRCAGNHLDDPAFQQRLIDEIRAEGIEAVAIEPLRSMSDAVDQGPRELRPLATYFRQRLIGETGVGLVLAHHNTKPQAGVSDTRRKAQQVSGGGLFSIAESPLHATSLDERSALLTPDAFKHGETPAAMILRLEFGQGWMRLIGEVAVAREPELIGLQERILDVLRNNPGRSASAIATSLRSRKEEVLNALKDLSAANRADAVKQGRFVQWFARSASDDVVPSGSQRFPEPRVDMVPSGSE